LKRIKLHCAERTQNYTELRMILRQWLIRGTGRTLIHSGLHQAAYILCRFFDFKRQQRKTRVVKDDIWAVVGKRNRQDINLLRIRLSHLKVWNLSGFMQ